MDLFDHRYYRLSKILMMLIGQWPYQSTPTKYGILAVILILVCSIVVPHLLGVVKYLDNADMLMQCFILYVFGAISVLRLFGSVVFSQKRVKLINLIRTDWQLWARDCEVNNLHKYTAQGEKLTIVYTVAAVVLFTIMTVPLIPTFIDMFTRNGTTCREFPYPLVYYNIDEQKYFFHLVTYSIVCACLVMTIVISDEVTLITSVQHVCGIFAALGQKIQRIGNNATSVQAEDKSYELRNEDMLHLACCVDRHNRAIEFANLIESTYTWSFFMSTSLGVLLSNVVLLQERGDIITFTRFSSLILTIIVCFYVECYYSQILIDHSISIQFYIYNSQWYKLTPVAQKIVNFMILRCSVPCQLTAGNMMILSLRAFWLTFKTSLSFFGVVRSTQGL